MADLTRLCIGDNCSDIPEGGTVTKEAVLQALGFQEFDIQTYDENYNPILAHVIGTYEQIPPLSTTFFADGTLIINESRNDRQSNVNKHGAVLNTFEPFGDNPYIFTSYADRPYESVKNQVKAVEVGAGIAPTSLSRWFGEMPNLETVEISEIDPSNVTDMARTFSGCEKMSSLTYRVPFDVSNVTTMEMLFYNCKSMTWYDLSTWNTSSCTHMGQMFRNNVSLQSILASSSFVVTQVKQSNNMFAGCTSLVGGNGTRYNANQVNKTYARIDRTGTPGYFTGV